MGSHLRTGGVRASVTKLFRKIGIFLCACAGGIDVTGTCDCQDNPVTGPQLPLELFLSPFPEDRGANRPATRTRRLRGNLDGVSARTIDS
jgi:hypothetical protein